MRIRVYSLAVVMAIAAMTAPMAVAQNLFWSSLELGESAVEGPFVVNASTGDSGTIYLYYSPNGQDVLIGFDIDFSWSEMGVVGFTSAETFDFDVTIEGIPIGVRWNDLTGPAQTVTANAVTGLIALNA